jgi:AbrB family looped-hinge helix DNA binding protein
MHGFRQHPGHGHGPHGFGRRRHGRSRRPYVFGTTKVGERGQIVIPKEARDKFDIQSGDTLFIIGDEDRQGIAIVKADLLEGFALQILQGIGYFERNEEDQSPEADEDEPSDLSEGPHETK